MDFSVGRSAPFCLLLLFLSSGFSSQAVFGQSTENERDVARRLLELETAIEELLADLSPAARERVLALVEALKAGQAPEPGEVSEQGAETNMRSTTSADRRDATLPPPEKDAEDTGSVNVTAAESAAPAPSEPSPAKVPEKQPLSPTPEVRSATPTTAAETEVRDAGAAAASSSEPDVAGDDAEDATGDEADCLPLALFDTSGDGVLSGADRLWRHFYLQTDLPKDDGIVSLFELDIRSVALDVESYGVKGDAEGYVQRGSTYRFQLIGRAARRVADGLLAVDASGLSRNGTVRLLDADGNELEGFQVLTAGQSLAFASGERVSPLCR